MSECDEIIITGRIFQRVMSQQGSGNDRARRGPYPLLVPDDGGEALKMHDVNIPLVFLSITLHITSTYLNLTQNG